MEPTDFRLETPNEAEETIRFLDDKIYAHNSQALSRNDGRLVARVMRGPADLIVGALAGWIWAGACEVTLLWVHEDFRGKGLGQTLLNEIEREATQTGCRTIVIRSYSFQAPRFYEKHGYVVDHVLRDFPPGYEQSTLVKRL